MFQRHLSIGKGLETITLFSHLSSTLTNLPLIRSLGIKVNGMLTHQ